jgi:hypothetical protein
VVDERNDMSEQPLDEQPIEPDVHMDDPVEP